MTAFLIAAMIAGTVIVCTLFAIPIFALWSHHERKMTEIRLRQSQRIDESTAAAIEDLRREMASLRDTTTQYDVSFDSALQRTELRLNRMEERMSRVESEQHLTVRS